MNTLIKNPTRNLRSYLPSWYSPFDRFMGNDLFDPWDGDNFKTVPSVNISEEKDNYKVEMAAPGMKKEDFNIEVDANLITISSEKETGTKEPEKSNGYWRREYNYSSFLRSFTLPEYADTSKIIAKYNDGVLHLSVSKKPEAQKNKSQKIKVQ